MLRTQVPIEDDNKQGKKEKMPQIPNLKTGDWNNKNVIRITKTTAPQKHLLIYLRQTFPPYDYQEV